MGNHNKSLQLSPQGPSGTVDVVLSTQQGAADAAGQLNSMLDGFSLVVRLLDRRKILGEEDWLYTGSAAGIKDGEMELRLDGFGFALLRNYLACLGKRAI